nr:PREDICTED: uncharacterized protein LOC105676655 [Linepithema humile]
MVLKDLRLKLKVLANAIFGLVTIVKYGYVLLYKNKVRNCMMIIDEDWQNVVSPSDRNFMIDRVRFGKRLMVICAMFVYMSGVGVRMIMPLTAGKIVTSQNITIRPLPSAAYFVMFDVQRSPAYEIEWEDHNIVRLCTYSIGLMMLCFNIFIYCYMGEQVVIQGDKVALTACTLNWYRLPTLKARALILIISISDIPIKLSAGKFIDLSLRTFGNVIKMSVTYLNLLRKID